MSLNCPLFNFRHPARWKMLLSLFGELAKRHSEMDRVVSHLNETGRNMHQFLLPLYTTQIHHFASAHMLSDVFI